MSRMANTRQWEVLRLVAAGRNNADIGASSCPPRPPGTGRSRASCRWPATSTTPSTTCTSSSPNRTSPTCAACRRDAAADLLTGPPRLAEHRAPGSSTARSSNHCPFREGSSVSSLVTRLGHQGLERCPRDRHDCHRVQAIVTTTFLDDKLSELSVATVARAARQAVDMIVPGLAGRARGGHRPHLGRALGRDLSEP